MINFTSIYNKLENLVDSIVDIRRALIQRGCDVNSHPEIKEYGNMIRSIGENKINNYLESTVYIASNLKIIPIDYSNDNIYIEPDNNSYIKINPIQIIEITEIQEDDILGGN